MAQTSYRYNPIRTYDGYRRVDISWRTDDADDHHFVDEWGAGIPTQAAGDRTWHNIPTLKGKGRGGLELQMVDDCDFEFADDAQIAACLDPDNVSAEIRVWWSESGTIWYPEFWGIILLDNVQRITEAIVATAYVKRYRFRAFDGLKRLEQVPYGVTTRMSTTGYLKTLLGVANGDRDLTALYGNFGGAMLTVVPKNLVSGNTELINVAYYLEQLAYWAFDEQHFHTTGVDLAYFGYGASPVTSPLSFIAHCDTTATPVTIERTMADLHLFYDVFAGEWLSDFENWAEFLVMLAEFLGFALSTRHTLDSGRWIRSLQYSRLDGANGGTLTAYGVLIERNETMGKRMSRRVVVTTRFPTGGHKIDDVAYGAGTVHNLTTHFRTVGARNIDAANGASGDTTPVLTGDQKKNILWHTLVIWDSSVAYRLVNQVKVTIAGTDYKFPLAGAHDMWSEANLRGQNGVSWAIAWWWYNRVLGPGSRSVIEETRSNTRVSDGTTIGPHNWRCYALIGDSEYAGADYKVLEYTVNPENGEVKIVKEIA